MVTRVCARSKKTTGELMLDIGFRISGFGYRLLAVGCWLLDVRCLMFDFGYPMPEAGHRVLDNGWRIGGCVGGQTLPVAPVRMAGKRVICP